jgi:hypothetical protein
MTTSFLPPPPPEIAHQSAPGVDLSSLAGPPAPEGMVVGGKGDRMPTPYLGPDPQPSRPFALAFQLVCAGVGFLTMLRAGLYLLHWSHGRDLLASGEWVSTTSELGRDSVLLSALNLLIWFAIVAGIVCDLLWRRSRRTKDLRTAGGEAFVELPLAWVMPMWLRLTVGGCVGLGLLSNLNGAILPSTVPAEVPAARMWSAVGSVSWGVLWLLLMLLPVFANRAHDLRLQWSTWYRQHPDAVPYVPAVSGSGDEIATAEGLGWVVRTAWLILAGVAALIAALVSAGEASNGSLAAIPWLVGGIAVEVLVVRAFVRRHRPSPEVAPTPGRPGKIEG